jgi:rRNA processing protein Krr1/Pno1
MNGTASNSNGVINDLPQYDESFPPLGGAPTSSNNVAGQSQTKKATPQSDAPKRLPPKVKPASASTAAAGKQNRPGSSSAVLYISGEDRRFPQVGMSGEGAQSMAQRRVCQDIAAKTHVSIDLHVNKDRSLTVSISGKIDAVQEAKRLLSRELMIQSECKIEVPREFHRFILGKKGNNLHEIENRTGAKISVPRPEEQSDEIHIHGSKETLKMARDEILAIYHDQARRGQEALTIPKMYHAFLCGPSNRYVDELRQRSGAKINIPPPNVHSDIITITGEKEGVALAKKEILTRLSNIQKDCTTLTFPVPKHQHRYVIGVKGSGLREILEQTGVSVEVPPAESQTEEIVLRGPQEELGHALSLMVERARSIQQRSIAAPAWLHRYLIGRQGSKLSKITANHEKVRVEFHDNEDNISIEGPQHEVEIVAELLDFEVKQLINSISFVELPAVSQIYHKHIVGKNGANVERLQHEFGVQIKLQQSGVVRIEGPPQGVALAKLDIEQLLQKKENEKQKDLIIDHRYHRQLIGSQGSKIRDLRERFPNVQIIFPEIRQQSNIVQLRVGRK